MEERPLDSFELLRFDRQFAEAFTRRSKNRVDDGRCNSRGSWLSDPARFCVALNQEHLDCRRLVDAQHLVGVEIALHDATLLESNFAIEGRSGPEHDPALDLRLNGIGVDRSTAVHRAHDALDAHRPVPSYDYFGDFSNVGTEPKHHRNAAPHAIGQGCGPASLFSHEVKDNSRTRAFVE